jgi:Uncharacterized protein conserved in bacteria
MQIKTIKINGNDLCPCGSNKPFKGCCKETHYLYMLNKTEVITNFESRPIMYRKDTFDRSCDEFNSFSASVYGKSIIRMSELLDIILQFYNIVDKGLEVFKEYTPCEAGCSHCCNQIVWICKPEGELIRSYVIKNFSKKEIKKIEERIPLSLPFIPSKEEMIKEHTEAIIYKKYKKNGCFETYYKLQLPCVFLSELKRCSIYPVRPLACRTHLVLSKVDYCYAESDIEPFEINNSFIEKMHEFMNMINSSIINKQINAELEGIDTIQEYFKDGFEYRNSLLTKIYLLFEKMIKVFKA